MSRASESLLEHQREAVDSHLHPLALALLHPASSGLRTELMDRATLGSYEISKLYLLNWPTPSFSRPLGHRLDSSLNRLSLSTASCEGSGGGLVKGCEPIAVRSCQVFLLACCAELQYI